MKKLSLLSLASVALMSLTSCLGSDVETYDNWRKQNEDYIASIDLNEYERYVPSWAPEHAIYMKWHNDRALTAGNLVPISTSTVRVKYELEDIGFFEYVNDPEAVVVIEWADRFFDAMPEDYVLIEIQRSEDDENKRLISFSQRGELYEAFFKEMEELCQY